MSVSLQVQPFCVSNCAQLFLTDQDFWCIVQYLSVTKSLQIFYIIFLYFSRFLVTISCQLRNCDGNLSTSNTFHLWADIMSDAIHHSTVPYLWSQATISSTDLYRCYFQQFHSYRWKGLHTTEKFKTELLCFL